MKTRDQIYRQEAATLLRDLTTYHYIRHDQLLRMYPGKESKIDNLLRHLVNQGRIVYDAKTDMYHDGFEAAPDYGTLACLWVLIDFIDKTEYHSAVEFPANLIFLADGEIYEVLFVPEGKETLTEYAVASQGSDAEKRIVVVEQTEQIPRLCIPGTSAYCIVNMETGTIQYFKQEASDG